MPAIAPLPWTSPRRGYVVLAPTFRGRAGPEGRSEGVVQIGRNEVIDLLQLAQLGRKLEYVDSLRMAIIGEGHGATAALLAIERSNVFRAAVIVSPLIFSGMAEYGFTGIDRLRDLQEELFGRKLSRPELVRELYQRGMFRQARRIRTPMMFMHTDSDPQLPRPAPLPRRARRTRHSADRARVPRPVPDVPHRL